MQIFDITHERINTVEIWSWSCRFQRTQRNWYDFLTSHFHNTKKRKLAKTSKTGLKLHQKLLLIPSPERTGYRKSYLAGRLKAKDNIKYYVLCACVYARFYVCCMMLCYIWYFSWVKKTILSLFGNLGAQNTDCKGPKKNDLSYEVFWLSILCNLKSTWVT